MSVPRKRDRQAAWGEGTLSSPAAHIQHKLLIWRRTEGPVTDTCPTPSIFHYSNPDPRRNHSSALYSEVTPELVRVTLKPEVSSSPWLPKGPTYPKCSSQAEAESSRGSSGTPNLPAVLPSGQEIGTHSQP